MHRRRSRILLVSSYEGAKGHVSEKSSCGCVKAGRSVPSEFAGERLLRIGKVSELAVESDYIIFRAQALFSPLVKIVGITLCGRNLQQRVSDSRGRTGTSRIWSGST